MTKMTNIFTSVVIVFDKSASDVNEKTLTLSVKLKKLYANYEIVIVDNGMPSEELHSIKGMLESVACIRVIRLSRVYDTDTAIFAGVEATIGDVVCILYQNDPVELVPEFVNKIHNDGLDIVFGVAANLRRNRMIERVGAKLFYAYSKKYMSIDIPHGSTFFISMNRSAANALTRSGRNTRHIRQMTKQLGFNSDNLEYELPTSDAYSKTKLSVLFSRAIDQISNYSSHPLRSVTYFGLFAGMLNIFYAMYVVVINLTKTDVEKGWTTLSLEFSVMFFILFIILAILAEYIGKILSQTQQEPPYHIMQELSSVVSIADETRRNVTK